MGVVKRWVLRGLWRRLVGVGIIGPGLLGAPAFLRLTPWRVFLSAFRCMALVSLAALIPPPKPSGSGLYNACIVGRVVLPPLTTTWPSLCALEALRGTSGGETMTTAGGAGTPQKALCDCSRARRTGFYRGVGALWLGAPTLSFAPVPGCRVFLMYTTLICT